MKKLLFIWFLCLGFSARAQVPKVEFLPTHDDKTIHFGFNLGLNTMTFGVQSAPFTDLDSLALNADVTKIQPGFHVRAVINLRLAEYIDLRFLPGIAFGQRQVDFINIRSPQSPIEFAPQKINSSFVDLPFLIKYKAKRINNFRPYLIGGLNTRIDMASKKNYSDEDRQYLRLKPLTFYAEFGFGYDYYMQYFKFSAELIFSLGFTDSLVHDDNNTHPEFVRAIDRLTSRLVMLSFYFE